MSRGGYFRLILWPLLVLSLVPAGLGLLLMVQGGDFMVLPIGMIMGVITLLFTATLLGAVLGVAAVAIWQPTYARALLAGFGLPVAAGMVLAWLRVFSGQEFRDYTLLVCLLLSPIVVGTGALHGVDTRRLLRWGAWVMFPALVPLLVWLPRWAMPTGWQIPRSYLAMAVSRGLLCWPPQHGPRGSCRTGFWPRVRPWP
jgi:hypothetical protein